MVYTVKIENRENAIYQVDSNRPLLDSLREQGVVDLDEVQTNMVFIEFENGIAPKFRKFMEQKGMLLGADWNNVIRLVTHLNCQKTDVDLFASEAKSFFE